MSTLDILLPPLLRWTVQTPVLRPLALLISDAAALAIRLMIATLFESDEYGRGTARPLFEIVAFRVRVSRLLLDERSIL